MLQLDFLKTSEELEMEALKMDVKRVFDSSEKVRKGTYASINVLRKQCLDLTIRLEIIERHICKTDHPIMSDK